MAKKSKKVKTKVKQKTSVSQQVNVYVTKRGGSKRISQPSQAVQLLQTITPLLAQQRSFVPSAQPLIFSQQQLQQLSNLLEEQRQQQSDIRKIATPSIDNLSPLSLKSFAFDFENDYMKSGKSYILDIPDAPLVEPDQAIVSGGPIRLDNPHEDTPIDEVSTPYQIPPIDIITEKYIRNLPNTATPKSGKITLRQLANNYGIILTREDLKNKTSIVNRIWTEIQRRKANPNLSSSAPK